jgi:Patatin-like phospholipase
MRSEQEDSEVTDAAESIDHENEARLMAMDRHLAGLALSGGGIRSATFALGVLQGLAHLRILSRFDYLSTVSGGGYIGGWLAAWIKRQGNPLNVEKQLSPSRIIQAESDPLNRLIRYPIPERRVVDEEPEPVHHLRSYSNYLTPRPGLLTVDTWTVLTIYVRNALINLLLLLPLAMILVLLGRLAVLFYATSQGSDVLRSAIFWTLLCLLLEVVIALGMSIYGLRQRRIKGAESAKGQDGWNVLKLKLTIIWPMVAAAMLGCWSLNIAPAPRLDRIQGAPLDPDAFEIRLPDNPSIVHDLEPYIDATPFPFLKLLQSFHDDAYDWWYEREQVLWYSCLELGIWFALFALVAHLIGYLIYWIAAPSADSTSGGTSGSSGRLSDLAYFALCACIAGFTGGFLFMVIASEILWRHYNEPYLAVTVGPPLALLACVTATMVEVWLLSRREGDDIREWWARVCAWLVIYACAWFVFFAVTLYGPMLVNQFLHNNALRSGALLGWLATAAGGAVAGQRPRAFGKGGDWKLKVLVMAAPPVFVIGLLVVVSMLADAFTFEPYRDRLAELEKAPILPSSPKAWAPWVYWDALTTTPVHHILEVGLACAFLAFLASVMSNVNLFSLNSMYASRLIRCYLGASRKKRDWKTRQTGDQSKPGGAATGVIGPARRENSVTGFDPADDIPLWRLKIGAEPSRREARRGASEYLGPHLIMNTALNLVSGSELAWQDRKAESFILTPTHCGSKSTGYARTTKQTGHELTLGRAMSISGAAVDSNIGLHQSSALIALMTAFNARLGWWIKNPNRPEWDAESPSLALPLLLELFGKTDAKQKYVHLSDGGHFENLAVYELVRRRCRYIVCCDAGTDPQASDDNLANMIRLCRTDFGVRIDIDTTPLARQGSEKLSRWHCAVGKIHYEDVDGGELPGVFIYLRTSLTGDEPSDVQEYAAKNPDFPWQSTLDQFFDEAQFESYRALGFHVVQTAFSDALDDVNNFEPLWSNVSAEVEFKRGNQRLFSAVQRRWAPAPANQDSSFSQAARSWTEFQQALRTDKHLASLSGEIYPELDRVTSAGLSGQQLHAVAQMIQVMENAWVDLQLSGFRDLPMNRGWMSVFRRWASTPALRRLWPILRGEFGSDFVKFCETQLELGSRTDAVLRSQIDKAFFDDAITILGQEFAREWPGEEALDVLIQGAEKTWSGWADQQPIALIIQAPPGGGEIAWASGKVACGIAFLIRLSEGDPSHNQIARFEAFIWMRRAYRGMGIASRAARRILTRFHAIAKQTLQDRDFVIQARYPTERVEHESVNTDGMEYLLWLNFFSHYDFRCPRGNEPAQGKYWVIERTFGPNDEI